MGRRLNRNQEVPLSELENSQSPKTTWGIGNKGPEVRKYGNESKTVLEYDHESESMLDSGDKGQVFNLAK